MTRKLTPEERELAKKQAELDLLEGQLAQRELDLATLQAELGALENQYLRVVGARYAELDEIQSLIAALQARLFPRDLEVQQKATEAQTQARESAEAASNAPRQEATFTPSDDLKRLYRQVARVIHPDLVTDPEERDRRHRFMTEVNAAYATGDESRLHSILVAWHDSPEAVSGDGIAAELVRMIRKIAQVEDRLAAINVEIEAQQASDLFHLREAVQASAAQGRDCFAELTKEIEAQIAGIRDRFTGLIDSK